MSSRSLSHGATRESRGGSQADPRQVPPQAPPGFSNDSGEETKETPAEPPRMQLLVRRGRRPAGTRRIVAAIPGARARKSAGGRRSSRRGNRGRTLGDVTLRDAAENLGTLVRGGAALVTKIFNTEEKVCDSSQAPTNVTSGAPLAQCLSLIAQGSDYNNRTGNSIGARSLYLTIYAYANATTLTNFLRVIVVQDLANGGTALTTTSVLETPTGAQSPLSHYLHFLGDRYRVLLDEHVVLTYNNKAWYQRYRLPIDTDILYNGTTAATGSNYNGTIWILQTTDLAANGPGTAFEARLTFVDN